MVWERLVRSGWLLLLCFMFSLIISLCIISLIISSSESLWILPPSVQQLLVNNRHCGKKKKTPLPSASSFNDGFAWANDMVPFNHLHPVHHFPLYLLSCSSHPYQTHPLTALLPLILLPNAICLLQSSQKSSGAELQMDLVNVHE